MVPAIRTGLTMLLVLGLPTWAAANTPPSLSDFTPHLSPKRGDGPRPTFTHEPTDIIHYNVAIELDHSTAGIAGEVEVLGEVTDRTIEQVRLHMGENLIVDEITGVGGPLDHFRQRDVLTVLLPESLDPGDEFILTIAYHGTGNVFDDYGMMFTEHATGPNIWTNCEPIGARLWMPCYDNPVDKATVNLDITVDAELVATSNGVRTGIEDNGDTRTWSFEHGHPVATYLVVVNASNFEVIEDSWDPSGGEAPGVEMPLTHYVWPQLYDAAVEDFSITGETLTLLSDWFGMYPFVDEGYGHTIFPWGGAMEHQTNTSYGNGLITGEHDFDNILVHEAAHHWFGDDVGPALWSEIWLNEGFATYSEAMWYAAQFGEEILPFVMDIFRWVYFAFHDGPDHPIWAPIDGHLFCVAEYYKGACVLHMLRRQVGEDVFLPALREYAEIFGGSTVVTLDFKETMEEASGQDLDWFFDQWVTGPGYPAFEYSWFNDVAGSGVTPTPAALGSARGEDLTVSVAIDQVQPWGIFEVPMDVRLFIGETVVDTTVWLDDWNESFTFAVDAPADSVHLDPNAWVFGSFEEIGGDVVSVPDRLVTPDMLVKPNPFRGAVAIQVPLEGTNGLSIRIFDAGGRAVRQLTAGTDGQIVWDGRDATGVPVAPGMYFLRADGPTGHFQSKILRLQ